MGPSKDDLILALAKLLSGKQVEQAAVERALELLCQSFSFDCGAVYEIDQYNSFLLREKYGQTAAALPAQFPGGKLLELCASCIAEQDLICVAADDPHPEVRACLARFSAESAAVTFVVDEEGRPFGFIALMNPNRAQPLPEDERQTLSVALSLLSHYVRARMFQNKISFTRASLERILDNTGIDIYVNDFHTHEVLYVNKSMARPYGGVTAFKKEKCWKTLFSGQTGPCEFCPQQYLVDEEGNPTKVYTWDYQRAFDGSWFRVFSAAFPWIDGRLAHVVSSADITDNKRNEELIQYMANYDLLTKLPNRRMLVSDCETRIDSAGPDTEGYLLFFDIDGFKAVNDQFGHDAGDELLVQLGEFFSGVPLLRDSIYRNGGDEFVAILDGVNESNVRNLAHFILTHFQQPWSLKKGDAKCGISIGVACYPDDGLTAEPLLLKADQAMYHVKKMGGSGICFARELNEKHPQAPK